MLRRYHIARLAFHHSPAREQRLLRIAPAQPKRPDEDETRMDPTESGGYAGRVELSERQKFHDAIFEAVLPDDQRTVLNEYLPSIQKELGTFNAEQLSDDELEEVMQLTRISLVDQMNREESDRRMLATSLKSLDPSTMTSDEVSEFFRTNSATIRRYFKIPDTPNASTLDRLQALLHKDMERLRKTDHERATGIRWQNLHAEDFEKIYREKRRVKSGESVRVPSAFAYKGTMYFNVDDETFTDPENGKLMADRAVAHEATHLAVGLEKDKRFDLGSWTRQLKSHPRWKELSAAVEEVFRSDPDYMEPGTKNEVITSEALSIYVANARHPLNENDQKAQQAVCEIMEDIFRDPRTGMITMMKKHLDETLNRFLELDTRNDDDPNAGKTVGQMLVDASNDSRSQRNLEGMLKGNTVKNADGVLTNTDEATELAKKELSEKDDEDAITPSKVSSAANKAYSMIAPLEKSYPGMKAAMQHEELEDAERAELLASVDQNLEFLSQTANDLTLIRKYADILERWTAPESAGGLSAAEKAEFADRIGFASNPYRSMTVSMEEADAQTKEDRETLLSAMQESVKNSETVLGAMQKAVDAAAGKEDDGHQTDMWQWLKKNVFSSQGNIAWMTPLNIMSIIKIYKDAIVQNYQSNQKVKENRFAKNWNIYKPIDHTLKKLARSANNTESSEFKEYLEKEGYTFDEVFGKDGRGKVDGLLHDNRHNFNRAKAVLEYAADHAWLYFLDPLHGHDVYGIDFEGIEGKQSFEELVQQHESGKSKQIDHGYERVDKYPDVPPIMDTMVHELRHKNIFAVQGIMKRLQDKAKFSHSNTWMLTTLLMLIRDECDNDPTLKYCLDKGMIDNISNHTIQQSAWSITWLKMLRTPIMDWKTGKDKFDNNILTQTMEKIEKKLEQAGADFPDTPEGRLVKYEAIAMVLSGKPLHEGSTDSRWSHVSKFGWNKGAVVSLYEDDFTDYRKDFDENTEQASCSPKETDPDYFNVRNGGSDVMLLNRTMVGIILEKTSTGTWTFKTQAEGFMAQTFDRHEELGKINPEAQKHLEEEMRKKISNWWINTDSSRKNQFHANKDQKGRLMWAELISRNLLDSAARDDMVQTIQKNYIKPLKERAVPPSDPVKAADFKPDKVAVPLYKEASNLLKKAIERGEQQAALSTGA